MATLEQIANALRNADAAGDVEAARRLAAAYRQLQSQTPREQAGFGESFKEAFTSLKAAPAAARFAAAKTPEEQRAAREELLEASEGEGAPRTAFADIEDFGSALDWAKQTAGASAGFLAAPLAAGAAGLAAGPVGGAVGLYGTLASQYTTQNLVRQAEEQARAEQEGRVAEETSVGKAVTAAGAATALDAVGFRFFKPIFSKFPLVGKLFGQGDEAAKEATDRIIEAHKNGSLTIKGGIAKGIAGGAVIEVPQEIAQTALERWQAGLSLFDADAKSEYIEAAAGGALIGAGLGGAGGAAQVRADRRRAEEALAEKDRIEKEEADAKQKAEDEAAGITTEEKPVLTRTSKATEEELTQAQTILSGLETDQEVKPLDFERALIEGGIPKNRTRRVISALKANKLLEEDKETGLSKFTPPVEVPAYTAPEGADEFVEEGVEGEPAPPPPAPAPARPPPAGPAPPGPGPPERRRPRAPPRRRGAGTEPRGTCPAKPRGAGGTEGTGSTRDASSLRRTAHRTRVPGAARRDTGLWARTRRRAVSVWSIQRRRDILLQGDPPAQACRVGARPCLTSQAPARLAMRLAPIRPRGRGRVATLDPLTAGALGAMPSASGWTRPAAALPSRRSGSLADTRVTTCRSDVTSASNLLGWPGCLLTWQGIRSVPTVSPATPPLGTAASPPWTSGGLARMRCSPA